MVPNVRYSNGPPSYVTVSFEYQTPILSGIQVFGIQVVTVIFFNISLINVLRIAVKWEGGRKLDFWPP